MVEEYASTNRPNTRELAALKSSMGRVIEQARVASIKTRINRRIIKESDIDINMIYNQQVNDIKLKERPD